jgi:hypothetical protein
MPAAGILILVVLFILSGAGIFLASGTRNIFYDGENMYLTGFRSKTTVPLSDLRRIKITPAQMTFIVKYFQYKIEYVDEDGEMADIELWVRLGDKKLSNFEAHVKEVKPNILVEHWYMTGED